MTMTATRWFAGLAAGAVALASLVAFTPGAQAQRTADEAKAAIGEKAPMFTLTDLEGNEVSIEDHIKDGKIVVLEWFNPKCPFVVKHHGKMTTMKDLAEKYEDEVAWVQINSTHPGHSNYGHDKDYAEKWKMGDATILADEDGKVGKMYGATKTPHMYVIDTKGVLRYHGAIDNHRSANPPSDREKRGVVNYVEQALKQIMAGETVTRTETQPYGCSVKYAD